MIKLKTLLNEKGKTWGNEEYGFAISKVLLPLVDKKIKGKKELKVSFNDNATWVKNLFFLAKQNKSIKSLKYFDIDETRGTTIVEVEVDVNNWYEFLRTLSDGELTSIKLK